MVASDTYSPYNVSDEDHFHFFVIAVELVAPDTSMIVSITFGFVLALPSSRTKLMSLVGKCVEQWNQRQTNDYYNKKNLEKHDTVPNSSFDLRLQLLQSFINLV